MADDRARMIARFIVDNSGWALLFMAVTTIATIVWSYFRV